MVTVNWPNLAVGYNDKTKKFQDYGFDLRDILDWGMGPGFASASSFKVLGSVYGGGTTSGNFVGSFETDAGMVLGGTINSFSRSSIKTYGTITGLNVDFKQAEAAAATPGTADDMALWAQAFAGDDVLKGSKANDRLEGFAGNDKLTGGIGADKLYGGAGKDAFIFKTAKDSTVSTKGMDTIFDFKHAQGDKIDLNAIDANAKSGGNQAFSFIGKEGFHNKAGELRYEKKGATTYVYGDTNGDGAADFAIAMKGVAKLVKGDFIL